MRRRSVLAEDQTAVVWPAWLFSSAFHAAALTVAAISGAEMLRGGFAPPERPTAMHLDLQLTDEQPDSAAEESEHDVGAPAAPTSAATEEPPPPAVQKPLPAPPAETPTAAAESAADADTSVAERPLPSVLGLENYEAERAALAAAAANASNGDGRGHVRVGHLGGKATVRLFGVEGTGSSFVYVFDRSTSMAGAPLAAAQQQLLGSLDALSSVHQFHIIFFNHRIDAWSGADGGGRTAFATQRNKRLAADFVRGITAHGGTYRLDALHKALRLSPDVIFFLTDADDTMPAGEVAEAIRLAGRSGTMIACIEFGVGPASARSNFLTELARGAGGQYAYVNVQNLRP